MKTLSISGFIVSLIILTAMSACKDKTESSNAEDVSTVEIVELTPEESSVYLAKGQSIAKATFEALSGNLKKALEESGVKEASEYCNIVAMPLTDSLSTLHQASIKRTSLKLRNPENKPGETELAILEEYRKKAEAGSEMGPMVKAISADEVAFYAPIKTQTLCLTCHGVLGAELTQENYAVLSELYPEDQATGYKDNEWRGIWSISFKK